MDPSMTRPRLLDVMLHPVENSAIVFYESREHSRRRTQGKAVWTTLLERIPFLGNTSDLDSTVAAAQITERYPFLENCQVQKIASLIQECKSRIVQEDRHHRNEIIPVEFQIETGDIPISAEIDELELYIEDMYEEEMSKKIISAKKIDLLFRDNDNLEVRSFQMALVLSRTLHEDGKKSVELAATVFFIFAQISQFTDLHSIITDHRIGSAAMSIMSFALQQCSQSKRPPSRRGRTTLVSSDDHLERLFAACLCLLLNLSRDAAIEHKMIQKDIVQILVQLLCRTPQNQIKKYAFRLLLTMSKRKEILKQLHGTEIISVLGSSMNCGTESVCDLSRRLLASLALFPVQRKSIVQQGLIPIIGRGMYREHDADLDLRLLTLLSMDESHKSLFSYSGTLTVLMARLVEIDECNSARHVLLVLLVSLAQNERNCEVMMNETFFQHLLRQAVDRSCLLSFKILRNIVAHHNPDIKAGFCHALDPLLTAFKDTECMGIERELVSIFANLSVKGLDFSHLLLKHDLMNRLGSLLSSIDTDEEVLGDVIVWMSYFCTESFISSIVSSSLIDDLVGVIELKRDNPAIHRAACLTIEKLLGVDAALQALTQRTQCVSYLIRAWCEGIPEISAVADRCLDRLMSSSQRWHDIIQKRKFETYNASWIDRVFALHEQISHRSSNHPRRPSSGLKTTLERAIHDDEHLFL